MTTIKVNIPVFKAIEKCGSEKKLAGLLGVSSPTIQQWKKGQRPVPAKQCVAIERVTEGLITRQDLRPNDWLQIWPELAAK